MLPFVIAGLVSGAVYGLAGVGLVLTYKTSRVFNFAHGALAAVAAYSFYSLHVQEHIAWPLAAAISVLGIGTVLGVALERLASALADKPLALGVAGTVGVLLIVEGAVALIYGTLVTRTVPIFLGSGLFSVAGTTVQVSSLVTFLVATLATIALYLIFRFTRMGMTMRAVVDSPSLLELFGLGAASVRRRSWVIGVWMACATGVLFASLLPLNVETLTLLVVQAFGAAAIGSFENLPITFIAGLAIGVASSISSKYSSNLALSGLPGSLPFFILFIVLLAFPKRRLVGRPVLLRSDALVWRAPGRLQAIAGVAVVVGLCVVPVFAGTHQSDWTVAVAMIILFLSLGLLVRMSGQVSLCHVTFLAIGAAAFSHLHSIGIPWVPALLLSSLLAVPIGAVLAIPAIRLSPLFLALATFGFGLFVQYIVYPQTWMFGSTGAALPEPLPHGLGLDSGSGYYYLVVALALVATVGVVVLSRSRLGRLLQGLADSPVAVTTMGVTAAVTWVLVFCLSAAMAAGAGALIGVAQQSVSSQSYDPLQSLTYLALVVIAAGGLPWYAVVSALAITLPGAYFPSVSTGYWLELVFGVTAVGYAMTPSSRRGVPPRLRALVDGVWRKDATASSPAVAVAVAGDGSSGVATSHEADRPVAGGAPRGGGVEVKNATVRFGGTVALDAASIRANPGSITGLVGPNGAGKTTLFNVVSGLTRPRLGRVLLDGRNISRLPPAARARAGIGRTFQRVELFDSLTVWENVTMGREGTLCGRSPIRHILPRRGDRAIVDTAVAEALELCGIGALAARPVHTLTTGQERLVELARCLAGPFDVLLLDEPSAGLDRVETERFAGVLKTVIQARKVGILLVEHDMRLVMNVCHRVYVLNFGHIIFQGDPAEVAESPEVRTAYLGDTLELEGRVAASAPAPAQTDGGGGR